MSLDERQLLRILEDSYAATVVELKDFHPFVLAVSEEFSRRRALPAELRCEGVAHLQDFLAHRGVESERLRIPQFDRLQNRRMQVNSGPFHSAFADLRRFRLEQGVEPASPPLIVEHFLGTTNAVAIPIEDRVGALVFDCGLHDFVAGCMDGLIDFQSQWAFEGDYFGATLFPEQVEQLLKRDPDSLWLLCSTLMSCVKSGTSLCGLRLELDARLEYVQSLFLDIATHWIAAHEWAHVVLGHVATGYPLGADASSVLAEHMKDQFCEFQADSFALDWCVRRAAPTDLNMVVTAIAWLMIGIDPLEVAHCRQPQGAEAQRTHPPPLLRLAAMCHSFPAVCRNQGIVTASQVQEMDIKMRAFYEMHEQSTNLLRRSVSRFTTLR